LIVSLAAPCEGILTQPTITVVISTTRWPEKNRDTCLRRTLPRSPRER
jgi:hypothetical protein